MIKTVMGAALLALAGATAAPAAEMWDYPEAQFGTPNPARYSFSATTAGMLTAFFMPSTGYYMSALGVKVNGATLARGVMPLGQTANFTPYDFGQVAAGDRIEFFLDVWDRDARGTPLGTYSSSVAANADGRQHVWAAAHPDQWYLGPRGVPEGVFIGFEDTTTGDPRGDYNYRDYTFVVPNLTVARVTDTPPTFGAPPGGGPVPAGAVPEPASWALLTAGFGLVGFAVRRGRRAGARTQAA